MTDHQIIVGCQNHDSKAFKALVERYAPILMAVGMRYLRNKQLAEDALQESYIAIFKNIAKYADEGKLKAWLVKIMVNNCLKAMRINTEVLPIDQVSFAETNETNIVDEMEVVDMMKIVEQLPTQYYAIFNLYIIEGYTHKEISEMLDIPESSCRVYLTRARSLLKSNFIKLKIC